MNDDGLSDREEPTRSEQRIGRITFSPSPDEPSNSRLPAGYGLSRITDRKPRCWRCDTVVAWYATRPWKVMCRKCRAVNRSPGEAIALGPVAEAAVTTRDRRASM